MTTGRKLLYVTDLHYPSRGRVYHEEDLWLSEQLRAAGFHPLLCHPKSAAGCLGAADLVLFRNAGPVAGFRDEYLEFRRRAAETGVPVYNQLTGKADMQGKQYLVDLAREGFPIIPTVDRITELDRLPQADRYVVKPKDGADSVGMRFVEPADLADLADQGLDDELLQPVVDFEYEVSFYFVDDEYHYALNAPDPDVRWRLEPYEATDTDLAFARRFIDWNDIDHGIQRVDAARTRDGELLLMELEDINPYLSLDRVSETVRDRFVGSLIAALR